MVHAQTIGLWCLLDKVLGSGTLQKPLVFLSLLLEVRSPPSTWQFSPKFQGVSSLNPCTHSFLDQVMLELRRKYILEAEVGAEVAMGAAAGVKGVGTGRHGRRHTVPQAPRMTGGQRNFGFLWAVTSVDVFPHLLC